MKDSIGVTVFMFLLVLVVSIGACSRGVLVREDVAVRALEIQGYSDIKVTDSAWFAVGYRGCDEKDAARFTAVAKNPAGKQVQVYVCTGWPFKGATVRTK